MPSSRNPIPSLEPLPLQLPSGSVLWWSIDVGTLSADVMECASRILSGAELDRISRLRRSTQRNEALISRAALRLILSWFCGVPAQHWVLAPDAFGRPVVKAPATHGIPCFNVSHRQGQVHICIRWDGAVGIDVEYVDDDFDFMLVAQSVLSSSEMLHLTEVHESIRKRTFFRHWVVKEAYVKALGLGLSKDLTRVELISRGQHEWHLRVDCTHGDDPGLWQICPEDTSSRHVAAMVTTGTPVLSPLPCFRVIASPEDFLKLLESELTRRSCRNERTDRLQADPTGNGQGRP